MNIKKLIGGLRTKLRGEPDVIVESSIAGKPVKCLKGTISKRVDQDDAWFYHLTGKVASYYDIGANVGYTALLGLMQGEKQILLVDPNPLALSRATKNLIINNVGRKVNFWPAFASVNKGDQVKFYTVGTGAAGSMYKSHAQTAASINSFYYVDTISVDYLFNHYQYTPDLVKIDVEGAEILVLNGSTTLAKEQKSMFFIEMHSNEERSMLENARDLLAWCQANKYKPYYLKTHQLLNNAEDIADRGKCHVLLLPEQMAYPEGLSEIEQGAEITA